MKFKFKHRLRFYFNFLRQRTPHFDGQVKHLVWGSSEKVNEVITIPKTIWLYWDEEKINSITVELCINLIKNLHPNYRIHLLNSTKIFDYLPDFPTELIKKPSNFVSDMVRLMLLEKHGGIYLDATVLLSKPLDWAVKLQRTDLSETVLYYTDENTLEQEFPMIETWFIAATPKSNFISAWRKEYQNSITSANPESYYIGNDLLPLSKFPLEIPYYLSYMAAQIVIRKNQDYRLSLLRAEDDAFSYGLGFKKKWDEVAMADVLLFNEKSKPLPNLIKLIRYDRRRLDYYIQKKFYKKSSWLGGLLP